MNRANGYSILVVSTDSFSDCWEPFFRLYDKYWNPKEHPIYLVTDTLGFVYPPCQPEIIHVGLNESGCRYPWGHCVIAALERVPTDIILLMLDDFFISGPVCVDSINKCLRVMHEEGCGNITLTNHDVTRRHRPSSYNFLRLVDADSPYRVTTSPALWTKECLRRYLDPSYSIWDLEGRGTRHSWSVKEPFYRFDERTLPPTNVLLGSQPAHAHRAQTPEIIPYFDTESQDTAIVKGRWQRPIRKFLAQEGIQVNFGRRGFCPGRLERALQRPGGLARSVIRRLGYMFSP